MGPDTSYNDGQGQSQGEEKVPTSYWTMPHRSQIFILVLVRLTEPIAYSSVGPYLYYMIKDFGYEDPSKISELGTLVMATFALGQALTSVWWGKFSDTWGRKPALCLGSFGTIALVLMLGFSTNIYMAISARLLAGLLNGNVGVLRTMVAELIGERKEYQARAFALMPITMNIGMIIGPIIGGFFSNPVDSMPTMFGWCKLLAKFPYLLPNLVILPLLVVSLAIVLLFVEETLPSGRRTILPKNKDPFLKLGEKLKARCMSNSHDYHRVSANDDGEVYADQSDLDLSDYEDDEGTDQQHEIGHRGSRSEDQGQDEIPYTSIRSILTYKVKITLISFGLLFLHTPAFIQVFPLFLSTPPMADTYKNPLLFNGGLGLSTSSIGLIMSGLGIVGISLQLLVYPRLVERIGSANTHKLAVLLFPISYFLIPYLSLLPKDASKSEKLILCGTVAALAMVARTFAVPPMGVLVTNSAPSKKVMGTLHGLTQSVTSSARCIGPFLIGNCYSLGVKVGMVGLAWFLMVIISVVEIILSSRLKEWGSEEDKADDEEHQ